MTFKPFNNVRIYLHTSTHIHVWDHCVTELPLVGAFLEAKAVLEAEIILIGVESSGGLKVIFYHV